MWRDFDRPQHEPEKFKDIMGKISFWGSIIIMYYFPNISLKHLHLLHLGLYQTSPANFQSPDCLMRIDHLCLVGKIEVRIQSCLANLGVPSCPIRKLKCPVKLSPIYRKYKYSNSSNKTCVFILQFYHIYIVMNFTKPILFLLSQWDWK